MMVNFDNFFRDKLFSFSVSLGFVDRGRSKYLFFNPYVSVQSFERSDLVDLVGLFRLEHSKIFRLGGVRGRRVVFRLVVQNLRDVGRLVVGFNREGFSSSSFVRFKKCFFLIRNKRVFKSFDPVVCDVVSSMVLINSVKRVGSRSVSDYCSLIKDFFSD